MNTLEVIKDNGVGLVQVRDNEGYEFWTSRDNKRIRTTSPTPQTATGSSSLPPTKVLSSTEKKNRRDSLVSNNIYPSVADVLAERYSVLSGDFFERLPRNAAEEDQADWRQKAERFLDTNPWFIEFVLAWRENHQHASIKRFMEMAKLKDEDRAVAGMMDDFRHKYAPLVTV